MNLMFMMCILTLMFPRKLVSAQFRQAPPETASWTSCEQFIGNATLDPNRLLDKEWKIFFFWSPEPDRSYSIKFSKASSVLVDRFRVELDKSLKPPANWSEAELFMETSVDFSALLVKTETPGIYRVIPTIAFEYVVQTPLLIFAFKVVEPGILGIANCRYRLCYALAPVDNMPHHNELERVASTLNFYNPHNRTHIEFPTREPTVIPYSESYAAAVNNIDDDHQEDLEVEQDLSRMDFF